MAAIVASAAAVGAGAASAEPLPTQHYLTHEVALEAAQAALATCKAAGHHVSVSVMNSSGMELVLIHDEFGSIHGAYSAHAKAYTVLSYSYSSGETTTSELTKRITQSPAAIARINGIPGLILAPGGVLIKFGNETVGAIGVGGTPGGVKVGDEECAKAGIAKIADRLR
ncbi:MAG: GlcG/HbpS family heme-binding protein [Gemmatimonas sp.]